MLIDMNRDPLNIADTPSILLRGIAMIALKLTTPMPTGNNRAEARHDELQRSIVERGISMQQSSNTMSAVEFLKSRDVETQVIARVLLEPERRRSNDS